MATKRSSQVVCQCLKNGPLRGQGHGQPRRWVATGALFSTLSRTSSPRTASATFPRTKSSPSLYISRPASSGSEASLMRTPLHQLHKEHGARFVPFGGFSMPVQYRDLSLTESHLWTREKASLFDVSHMVQHHITGPGAAEFLERLTPTDVDALQLNHGTLSVLLHPKTGGIVDDTVITRLGPEHFYLVTNAACREKDGKYLAEQLSEFKSKWPAASVNIDTRENEGLLALQGPLSAEIMSSVLADPSAVDLKILYFGQCRRLALKNGIEVLASRAGYTGEDGFEMSIPAADTLAVAEALLHAGGDGAQLRFAGLGARDSLRLEAGMCLYGHDLDDSTTPVEGGLSWVVAKGRREESRATFHGADKILDQLRPKKDGGKGVSRRRVGLVVEGAPAREGAKIVAGDKQEIGVITSGCPSPSLGKNIAMGYVKDGMHKAGTEVEVLVRGKARKAVVTKMPFVPSRYHKVMAS